MTLLNKNHGSAAHSLIKKEISLQFFQENRDLAIVGIEKVDSEICIRVFTDLMNEAASIRHNGHILAHAFGRYGFQLNNNSESVDGRVLADERTMFVTFSKRYPVAEWEMRDFFTRVYEDCDESFYMQRIISS